MAVTIPFLYIGVAVAILMAIDGAIRGSIKESVVTVVVLALSFLLIRDEWMQMLIDTINDVNSISHAVFQVHRPDLAAMAEAAAQADPFITEQNAHYFFLVTMVVLLIGAYLISSHPLFKAPVNSTGRAIGAVLGAFNGYMIVAIAKEYLTQSFWRPAQQLANNTLSLQIRDVPAGFPPQGYAGIALLIFVLILTALALISGIQFQLPVKAR